MAATREKRSTAGNRMSKMIAEEEDDDDFYKTTYGGFNEEASDHSYDSNASDSDDVIDSDFDIDEDDELRSDLEDDDGPKSKKRKVGVVTKSYKEPKKKTDDEKAKDKEKAKKRAEEKKQQKAVQMSAQIYHSEKKSLRRSTAKKSEAAEIRKKARDERTKMMKEIAAKKNVPEVRRLTQEELLEESKITERENAQSLEDYRKMELERKKSRVSQKKYVGPIVRYHSCTMPLIDELPSPEINVDSEFDFERVTRTSIRPKDKCSRTFITFTDDKTFDETFLQRKNKVPVRQYCPVTRLPAKYFDPVTQTPYASAQAFRCIRDAYNQHIQLQLEKRKREMAS
ncbi:vacuolar protein sorting-associated protein 72 homolog [Lineus longissimus]|uniref:vacuolar protein sorting-associated protein 72 homolog n=1 Tax=Lineus longissimus TaxID=88925 RepID=UPI002B4DA636